MNIQCLIYDIETYPNFFMIGYSVCTPVYDETNNPFKFEYKRYYVTSDDMPKMKRFLCRCMEIKDKLVMIGYNNNHYDKAMLEEAYNLRNKPQQEFLDKLYELSCNLVCGKDTSYRYKAIAQYDLLAKGQSLKSVGALIHQDYIIELPYEPSTILTEEQKQEIITYNQENDMDITEKILNLKFDSFITQYDTITEFNLPLSSFSSSASGLSELVLGDKNRVVPKVFRCTYKCPYKFDFKDETLKQVKYEMENTTFTIGNDDDDGFKREFNFKGLDIVVGEGGIHACVPHYKGTNVIDVDVASYYPSMIINLDTLPTSKEKKEQYKQMKEERVILKRQGFKGKANARKLILNSAFGKTKFFSRNDKGQIKKLGLMFDFKAFMTTTLTGQLLLLKLMEDLYEKGYKTVYMNTDGLSFEPNGKDDWKEVKSNWEKFANVELEDTIIEKSFVRDVNNYVMIVNENGKLKRKIKGAYNTNPVSQAGYTANSAKRRICFDAVVKYLLDDVSIEETIRNSKDIRDFVLHNKFSGKFETGKLLEDNKEVDVGRVPRWYKSTKRKNSIVSKNKARGSNLCPFGATNVSIIDRLSDYANNLPNDLDYDWYINEAYRIYKELMGEDLKGNEKVKDMLQELRERGLLFNE